MRWFDGRVWVFDGTGRLLQADRLAFRYVQGRLVGVTGRGGRTVALEWSGDRVTAVGDVSFGYVDGVLVSAGDNRYEVDEHGRVVAVVDADGVVEARNSYDADGRVVEQESRFGRRTRYAYLPGRVTVVGDAGSEVTNTYVHDQRGRLLSVTDGHGARLSRTYDEWGNPVTVTDRRGAVTTLRWDSRGRLLRRAESGGGIFEYRYDEAGRVVEVSADGAVVRYRYSGEERTPVEVVDGEGGVARFAVQDGLVREVTDPDGVTLSFGFDDAGDLIAVTDALGNTARLRRDDEGRLVAAVTPLGRETRFRYDGSGRLVERQDPAGGVTTYEYSPGGRIVAVTDPSGARRETAYGPHGNAETTTDPLGHVTGLRWDDLGNLARMTAADGAKWDLTYDALSRLTATTDPSGATWLREYDAEGDLVAAIDPAGTRHSATVDVTGRITALGDGLTGSTFAYDRLGRTVAHLRPDGTAARAGYDRCGRRTFIEGPEGGPTRIEYTPAGRIRRLVSPAGRVTAFEHDSAGRVSARVDGAGRRTSYRYDADGAMIAAGLVRLRYDAAGRLTERDGIRYAYDAAGRVVAITDQEGGTRRFHRDQAGRVVAALDPLGNRTTYEYHPRGWLTRVTGPLGGSTSYRHDEAGRVVEVTDPLGRPTRFTYDPAGRLTSRSDATGRVVSWSYDASGRVATITAADGARITFRRDPLGRPVAVREADLELTLTWDRAGRLRERRRTITSSRGHDHATPDDQRGDDPSGRRGGLATVRRYGPDGERISLTLPDGSAITYRYDDGGLLSDMTAPLTGHLTVTRDALGRITAVEGADARRATWQRTADGRLGGYAFGDRAARLTRDAAGRIIGDGEHSYGYDAAGQLVAADGRTLDYDAEGRLVRDGGQRFTYDAAGQLTDSGYEYDESGRRLRDPSRSYEWDGFGRLKSITAGGRTISVRIDPLGELAEVDGSPIVWDGRPCLIGTTPVAAHGVPWQAGSEQLTPDWQGTVGEDRDEWGAPALTDPGLGFHGELEFAGLTWLRNRVYDPSSRAFLSPDPMPPVPGTPVAGNPYHYAGNDPVGHADPLGLRPISDSELGAYRDEMGSGAFEGAADWVGENWEYLAAGAMVVGGVALMFTGVGGPAGIALMAASGGLIAGGASAGVQKFTTGEVDWGQVGKDALVGALTGAAGAGTVAALGSTAKLAATNPFVRELALNSAESLVSGSVERGLTGGPVFSPKALAADLLTGGAVPAPGNKLGADVPSRMPEPPPRPPEVGVDANPLIRALDADEMQRLDTALAGRAPVVSPQAASEYLARGSQERFDEFLDQRGGRIGADAPESEAEALRERALEMKDQFGNSRRLKEKDSRVAASVMRDDIPLITADKKFIGFLRDFPYPVEPF
ncbi:RHS repeat-associated core domain-containing protein [Actinoplanes sp. OR16]|uniref:RHS repeat-associated core domain-containing protein n=1 Tax=Actinoplanes sp. OR16 TaxID=946334 RepID=UPI00135F1AD9|nr:RHS repeat-associated core domain-containing protein [Actinoplanes sp. OR16]